jgi:hypothetical protein
MPENQEVLAGVIGGVVGAGAAIIGQALLDHLKAEYVRRSVRIVVPTPISAEVAILEVETEIELCRLELGKDQRETLFENATKRSPCITIQPRVENSAGYPLLSCFVYLNLNHEPSDVRSRHRISGEARIPIINPRCGARIRMDRLCWSYYSMELKNPPAIDVLPEESQPFELCQIYPDQKLLCFPSESGWERPRAWLRADKEYFGEIVLISSGIKSRRFDLRINAMDGGQLSENPVIITPQSVFC